MMKLKRIMLISILLLIVLTIGAASAATDDNMTQADEYSVDIGENNEADVLFDDEASKPDLDFEVEYPKEVFQNQNDGSDYERPYIKISSVPDDFTGQFQISANENGISYYSTGPAYQNIPFGIDSFALGTHNITVSSMGDEKYNPTNVTVPIDVVDFLIDIPEKITIGKNDHITVKAPADADGTLTVEVDGKKVDKVDLGKVNFGAGGYLIGLENLSFARHSIQVSYTGNYPSKSKKVEANVEGYAIGTSIIGTRVSGTDNGIFWITYKGSDNHAEIRLHPDAKNKPNITIDGIPFACIEKDDCYYVNLISLDIGRHTLTVGYKDDECPYCEVYEKFEVRGFIMHSSSMTYGDEDAVSLTLPENAKGNLKLYLSDDDYIRSENETLLYKSVKLENGKASIPVSDFDVGRHYLLAIYDGDDYETSPISDFLDVKMKFICPDEMTYGEDENITIVSSPTDNRILTYYMNHDEPAYTVQLVNGTGIISLKNAPISNRLYIDIYSSGEFIEDILLKVNPVKAKLTGGKDISMYYCDGSKYSVKVYGDYGKAVGAGETVTIKVGTTKYTAKTNKNGIATLAISNLPGKYTISATYKGVTVKNRVTVKKVLALTTVKVKKSAKKLVLSATLKKGTKAIKNTKVTFKFNGKTYSAKTNSKGVAKYTIKKSVLKKLKAGKKVEYQVTYKKCTVKRTATVKK